MTSERNKEKELRLRAAEIEAILESDLCADLDENEELSKELNRITLHIDRIKSRSMKRSALNKLLIFLPIVTVGQYSLDKISYKVVNYLAVVQMSNSEKSSFWIHIYSQATNYMWVIPAVLAVLIFRKELVYMTKIIKSKIKGEENKYEKI